MRALFQWAFAVLILAVFVELGCRAFDAEWDTQMRRNAQWRALAMGE